VEILNYKAMKKAGKVTEQSRGHGAFWWL